MIEFWVGIAVAFISAALGVIFEPQLGRARERLFFHGGPLSGRWRQVCPPTTHKNYERIDELEIHHRNDGRLIAFGRRVQPPDEVRSWRFEGHVSGNVLVAVFTPQKRPEDPGSFGVILLHQDSSSRTAKWTGGYVRPSNAKTSWHGGRQVLSHPLIWEKIH